MEAKTMKNLVSEIKDIISLELAEKEKRERKVLDSDVAAILGIRPSILAISKNRNKILYKEIAVFCCLRKLSLNLLLFSQSAESLVQNSHRYECKKYGLSA